MGDVKPLSEEERAELLTANVIDIRVGTPGAENMRRALATIEDLDFKLRLRGAVAALSRFASDISYGFANKAEARALKAERERDAAVALLRQVHTDSMDHSNGICPVCWGEAKSDDPDTLVGHADDCELSAHLAPMEIE